MVEKPSSHLHPSVGIIHKASSTSNTAPIAQKAWWHEHIKRVSNKLT